MQLRHNAEAYSDLNFQVDTHQPRVLLVPEDYLTIQAAIQCARNNDVVRLSSGQVFAEQIVLCDFNINLTIEGDLENSTVIRYCTTTDDGVTTAVKKVDCSLPSECSPTTEEQTKTAREVNPAIEIKPLVNADATLANTHHAKVVYSTPGKKQKTNPKGNPAQAFVEKHSQFSQAKNTGPGPRPLIPDQVSRNTLASDTVASDSEAPPGTTLTNRSDFVPAIFQHVPIPKPQPKEQLDSDGSVIEVEDEDFLIDRVASSKGNLYQDDEIDPISEEDAKVDTEKVSKEYAIDAKEALIKNSAIYVSGCGSVTFRNLTVEHVGIEGSAICVEDISSLTVENCVVTSGLLGIYVPEEAGEIILTNSKIQNCGYDGVLIHAADCKIDGCTISNNSGDGISLGVSTATISNSFFEKNSRDGISVFELASVTLTKCTVQNNKNWGVNTHGAGHGRITIESDCTFAGNELGIGHGLIDGAYLNSFQPDSDDVLCDGDDVQEGDE